MILDGSVNWNIFRYIADFLHFGGMLFGLGAICQSRAVNGFSKKTQVFLLMVYVTRYLDIFTHTQVRYLLFFKVAFNVITGAMLATFSAFQNTYDANSDSCNMVAILVPVAMAAGVVASGTGFVNQMWTFSEFLEPFALVPQYIMCYRAQSVRLQALYYVLMVGGYRLFYVLNWIYKRYQLTSYYHDYTSWAGGGLECVLFIDFLVRISQRREAFGELGASCFGRVLLGVDEWAAYLSEKIEMKVLGRRLPYGISGHVQDGTELSKRTWDVTDQHGAMESEKCGLLNLTPDGDPML